MAENGKLYELVAELLVEQRNTVAELKQMREDTKNIRLDLNSMRQDFNSRIERLEEAQKTTNLILQQHGRDLINIANILSERVVHLGDKVRIGTGSKKIIGNIVKVA